MRLVKHTFIFESDADEKMDKLIKDGFKPSKFRDYSEYVVSYYVV